MANADLRLPLNKRESINLRVFIHCDACTKSVKKVLNRIDGVESVVVDAELGKVTVLGTVDSKTLVKKLKKAGKRAEPWSGAMAMHHNNNNNNTTNNNTNNINNNNNHHNNHNHKEKLLKESKDKKAMSDLLESFNNNSISFTGGHANRNTNAIVGGLPSKAFNGSSAVNVNAMVASRPEAGPQYFNAKTAAAAVGNTAPILRFTTELAPPDYPTYIFSDENAHNCSIM